MCLKTLKTGAAICCLGGALFVGLPMMFQSEGNINVKVETVQQVTDFYNMSVSNILSIPEVSAMIDLGLKPYFIALGLIFLLVAIAWILIDGNEHTTTLTGRETDEVF